jgi:hypothetical protein
MTRLIKYPGEGSFHFRNLCMVIHLEIYSKFLDLSSPNSLNRNYLEIRAAWTRSPPEKLITKKNTKPGLYLLAQCVGYEDLLASAQLNNPDNASTLFDH